MEAAKSALEALMQIGARWIEEMYREREDGGGTGDWEGQSAKWEKESGRRVGEEEWVSVVSTKSERNRIKTQESCCLWTCLAPA